MSSDVVTAPAAETRADAVVIGSGPGGALTACLLAEAGRDVLLLEEGAMVPPASVAAFSGQEMERKYRHGSSAVALGRAPVAYVEGRCVGGSSEINSGMYHRPPAEVLDDWRRDYRVEDLDETALAPHLAANEDELGVRSRTGPAPAASLKMRLGAERLGWRCHDVPRFFDYEAGPQPGSPEGQLRSMTTSFVPRFLAAGGRLLPATRAHRLTRTRASWSVAADHPTAGRIAIRADDVFVAGGAVQTPLLLRRSGIKRNVGDNLRLHPMIRVAARFSDEVTSANTGVATDQVHEFVPRFLLGCSVTTPPFLALAIADHQRDLSLVDRDGRRMALYWAATRGGKGSVRALPLLRDPLVRYRLEAADLDELGEALRSLCRLLLAAGADTLWPAVLGQPPLGGDDDLARMPRGLVAVRTNLVTLHLFSSCPMGEDRRRCAVDSYGRVHGQRGLHVADASLLCTAPGVNPQGTIMGIVRRNVAAFLA